MPHLRTRTNTFGAIMRVRHTAGAAVRQYFEENGFIEVHTPILTSSDCEGAGEQFKVIADIPASTTSAASGGDSAKDNEGEKKDAKLKNTFFGTHVGLTVSGQLQAEMMACALSRVFTFGPTFRADNSNTRNHLAGLYASSMRQSCSPNIR